MEAEVEELRRLFRHHPPSSQQIVDEYSDVRAACQHLAVTLLGRALASDTRVGSDFARAIERLREVMFWTNAAIATARVGVAAGSASSQHKLAVARFVTSGVRPKLAKTGAESGKIAVVRVGEGPAGRTLSPKWPKLRATDVVAMVVESKRKKKPAATKRGR